MSTTSTTQAARFAVRQAEQALLLGDCQVSNVWWAIKVHLLYGRPQIQSELIALSEGGVRALVTAQRCAGSDPAAAWWAIKHCMVWQKELACA